MYTFMFIAFGGILNIKELCKIIFKNLLTAVALFQPIRKQNSNRVLITDPIVVLNFTGL